MKPKRIVKPSAKKNAKKRTDPKPFIIAFIIIAAAAALFAAFIITGIKLGEIAAETEIAALCVFTEVNL